MVLVVPPRTARERDVSPVTNGLPCRATMRCSWGRSRSLRCSP